MNLLAECPRARILRLVSLCLVLLLTLVAGHNSPAIASELDVLAKQTDKQIRSAERKMHSGKNQDAVELLAQAATGIETLKASSHRMVKSLESKYARTQKALDRKVAKSGAATPAASAKPAVAASGPSDKLPGGVIRRIKDINKALDRVEGSLGAQKSDSLRYRYAKATDFFATIDRQYSGKFSPEHPDYKAAVARYEAVGKLIDQQAAQEASAGAAAAGAKEEMQAKSDMWLQKFAPYMSASYYPAGHKPSRPIMYPGSSQPELYPEAEKRYNELKKIYEDFQKAGFPADNPWPLSQAVADVKYALDNYESSLKSSTASITGDAKKNVDQAMANLNKNQKWKTNTKEMPNLVDKKWMERIQTMVAQANTALKSNDPQLIALNKDFQALLDLDNKYRGIRADRRYVKPEIYKGKDIKNLQLEARRVVANERNNPKVLQVSIYGREWKEERVQEYTDTTKTKLRYRITRMINAQVAAKQGNGVMLHTIHLAQDMQGNKWGKLYGHIMYSDTMAAKNVGRKGP